MNGINFTLGAGTETYFACSAVFKGETFLFGGLREPNQVIFKNRIKMEYLAPSSRWVYSYPT